MARKTTLTQLEEREAALQKRLDVERKALRAIQAKRAAEERRAQHQRWMAAGQVIDALGLPLEVDELRRVLATREEKTHGSSAV